MQISTRGRYGLNAMYELALKYDKELLSIKEISRCQHVSEAYLEQLMPQLRRANLVESTRGMFGGYRLSRDPRQITIGEILRILEGSLAPVACLHEKQCNQPETCPGRVVWDKLYAQINQVINNMTLQDLVEEHAQKMERAQSDA